MQQEKWQNELHDIEYEGVIAKAPPCHERNLRTPLPQQSSPASWDEESQWISVDHSVRRRVAFEETAWSILRHLEDSDDVKVGIAELQEQLKISEEAGTSIRQMAQQAMSENGRKIFEIFRQGEE